MGAKDPRCPECGYTAADVSFHMDHHLCKGPGPASTPAPPGSAQSALDAVRAALENCPACNGVGWFERTTTRVGWGGPDASGEPIPVPVEGRERHPCECSAIVEPIRAALPVLGAELAHVDQQRSVLTQLQRRNGALKTNNEALRAEVERLKGERDDLHALKCAVGEALGYESGPPFADTVRRIMRGRDEALAALATANEDYRLLLDSSERKREEWERDMDVLRQRLVDEHDGSPGVEDALRWERQCHDAEHARDEAIASVRKLTGRCICGDDGPASYEGPLRDCPVHGEEA